MKSGFYVCLGMSLLVASCSERNSRGIGTLNVSWDITVNRDTETVSAKGKSGLFDDSPEDLLRLVDGDVLRLVWAGQQRQLYRRSEPYIYTTTFPLPESSNEFQARLDRVESIFDSAVINATVPETSSFQLSEQGTAVSETASLNFSWQLDSVLSSVVEQSVTVELQDCEAASGQSLVKTYPVVLDARSLSLGIAELPQPVITIAQNCTYTTRLRFSSAINNGGTDADFGTVSEFSSLRLQTLSRKIPVTVEYSGSAQ